MKGLGGALIAICGSIGTLAQPGEVVPLAADGQARIALRLPADASIVERTAAAELAHYLAAASGASFLPARVEGSSVGGAPAIHVGRTERVRRSIANDPPLPAESWVVRTDDDGHLLLFGGSDRGTLYAVYHFLEDVVGVRWWTPWEESVPQRPELVVGPLELRGTPSFAYRELTDLGGPPVFAARSRLNGHFTRVRPEHGGTEAYGGPYHAHTFERYVPAAKYFAEHPEYFSEVAGLRYGERTQLCLTEPALVDLMEQKLRREILRDRVAAEAARRPPPRIYNVSQNDWGRPCTDDGCRRVVEREGGQSGPLIGFVNELARRIADDHPEVLVETLAYHYTFAPPRRLRAEPNVSLRLSALYQRDFGKPVRHRANRRYRKALIGWSRKLDHLRIWDYVAPFAPAGELPLPNLRVLADDLRLYRARGVEGIYAQQCCPVDADMRDLKQWVLARLLEQPERDVEALLRDFTDGYYGPAGGAVRRYLDELERAARRRPSRVGFAPAAADYGWLDARFLARAQAIFDGAAGLVAGRRELSRRLRHARLTLDRATILALDAPRAGDEGTVAAAAMPRREEIVARYRRTWLEQIELRLPPGQREAAREAVRQELAGWAAARGESDD